ncbi:hypothetical protein [Embleya sp. NPDC050493]|uniref:hypothetical protein n=1 Tax=Embleya sp. NPDC050493 TaxID=3363989 RepID=UPI0037BAFB50
MENATSSDTTTRYIRLNLEIVLEVTDADALRAAALDSVKADEELSPGDRADATAAIESDLAESVSYLIDPFSLVEDIAGTELSEAGWQSEGAEYLPEDDDEDDEDA